MCGVQTDGMPCFDSHAIATGVLPHTPSAVPAPLPLQYITALAPPPPPPSSTSAATAPSAASTTTSTTISTTISTTASTAAAAACFLRSLGFQPAPAARYSGLPLALLPLGLHLVLEASSRTHPPFDTQQQGATGAGRGAGGAGGAGGAAEAGEAAGVWYAELPHEPVLQTACLTGDTAGAAEGAGGAAAAGGAAGRGRAVDMLVRGVWVGWGRVGLVGRSKRRRWSAGEGGVCGFETGRAELGAQRQEMCFCFLRSMTDWRPRPGYLYLFSTGTPHVVRQCCCTSHLTSHTSYPITSYLIASWPPGE